MGVVTQETEKMNHVARKRAGGAVLGWLVFAAACWIVRGTQFGWFMTPSLATVLGGADVGLIGGSSENTIAVEDLALLGMMMAGIAIALFRAVAPARRRRQP